jgi:hypothetical protein
MPDVRQQLKCVRDEAVAFFTHVGAIDAPTSSDLWESLPKEERNRKEVICEKLGQVVARISLVFQDAPALGDSTIRTLQRAVRRMDSALRFKDWEGWEARTQISEDHAIGTIPAGEYENLVSASTAQSIFEDAIESILGLLGFTASPDSTDAATANPTGCDRRADSDGRMDRRAAVDAYTDEVLKKTGNRIARADIWKSAGYRTRAEFERWESYWYEAHGRKGNKSANRRFTKVLNEKPHLK